MTGPPPLQRQPGYYITPDPGTEEAASLFCEENQNKEERNRQKILQPAGEIQLVKSDRGGPRKTYPADVRIAASTPENELQNSPG
jgi:hypothetical protein